MVTKKKSKPAKKSAARGIGKSVVRHVRVLTPRVTFVGGKWYNEHGKEVPRPQPQAPLQRYPSTPTEPPKPFVRFDERRIDGCTCAQPSRTGHVPGCAHFKGAVYNCEPAPPEDLQRFSALRGTPLARMQFDRLTQQAFPVTVPADDAAVEMLRRKRSCQTDLIQTDVPRRRCWLCPFWDRNKTVTPFDSQKKPQALDEFPEALEEEDDDLPF